MIRQLLDFIFEMCALLFLLNLLPFVMPSQLFNLYFQLTLSPVGLSKLGLYFIFEPFLLKGSWLSHFGLLGRLELLVQQVYFLIFLLYMIFHNFYTFRPLLVCIRTLIINNPIELHLQKVNFFAETIILLANFPQHSSQYVSLVTQWLYLLCELCVHLLQIVAFDLQFVGCLNVWDGSFVFIIFQSIASTLQLI